MAAVVAVLVDTAFLANCPAKSVIGSRSRVKEFGASRSFAVTCHKEGSRSLFSKNTSRWKPLGRELAKPNQASWICRDSATDGAVTLTENKEAVEEVPIEKRFPEYPTILDVNQIREILPHRWPFLLVDRVIEYNPGVSAVAIKNVTINDNFFPGHFPDRPIMPGVLMVEAMAQVGGIVMLVPEVGGSKESFFFGGVDKVRFRKPVVAGDVLVMRMNLIKLQRKLGIAKMEGKAYVGGKVVCEGEFLMVLGS